MKHAKFYNVLAIIAATSAIVVIIINAIYLFHDGKLVNWSGGIVPFISCAVVFSIIAQKKKAAREAQSA